MHELALIQEILDTVMARAWQSEVSQVTLIKLSVGKISGALPQALEFGFDAAKRGTPLEGARLVIEEVEPLLQCNSCQQTFTSDGWAFICAACGGSDVRIIKGQEVILEYFEGL
ncbi:MAG: hydrogenase nickel incorporation protein HypA/HybF [Clostridia bacterium]|nr:hydrogenase nickel incorporation protein HypA/HybF [Clostridia bacterium]